jgi:hypothetical protein
MMVMSDWVAWTGAIAVTLFVVWAWICRYLQWRQLRRYRRIIATGGALDRLAQHYGYWRRPGETDKQLRSRIAATWRLP